VNDTSSATVMRQLPAQGRTSPRFGHLGVWNYCLGPNSPIPGERLQVFVIDQAGSIVRRFEQIEGRCIDPGYVDFFLSHNCRPAVHERPIVDIDQNGKIAGVLHPNYTQSLGMEVYLQLLTAWANKWGRPEYAL
jgi:hypothetical protein